MKPIFPVEDIVSFDAAISAHDDIHQRPWRRALGHVNQLETWQILELNSPNSMLKLKTRPGFVGISNQKNGDV